MTDTDYDPVTLEVVRNALKATAEEMGVTLQRSAYSTNIKDRMDLSCAVYDASGRVVAQAEHVPLHLGVMAHAARNVFDRIDDAEPGDSFMCNDPYLTGSHAPDVTVFTPVFRDGERIGIVGNMAHHVDVGGMVPGSVATTATEIFQEGIRFPPTKIRSGGEVHRDKLDIFLHNLRTEEVSRGDLTAQIASNETGEDRVLALAGKYGTDTLATYMDAILDYSERRMAERIAEIPDGTSAFEDFVEGDGVVEESRDIEIRAEVTVDGDGIEVDFTGSDPQTAGPINEVRPHTLACVYFAVKSIVGPDLPTNAGTYRPIDVYSPAGKIVNANFPAPVGSANPITAERVVDVVLGCFRAIVPERVTAASSGTDNALVIGGRHRDRDELYSYVETYGGGQGAMHDLDGMDGVHTNMTNTLNAPAEVLEHTYPFEIARYELVENSEGAGEFRGGMGLQREVRIRNDATITVASDRKRRMPWGVDGGHDAASGTEITVVRPDGTREEMPSKDVFDVEAGTTVEYRTPGAGGWGEPRRRDPERVAADVADDLISPERARTEYGVVLRDDGTVDADATASRRDEPRE